MNLETIDYRLVRNLASPRIKDPGDAYYEDYFLPKFENERGFFRVTLWNMNYDEAQSTDQVIPPVEKLLEDGGSLPRYH